jgi:hypothetical protein
MWIIYCNNARWLGRYASFDKAVEQVAVGLTDRPDVPGERTEWNIMIVKEKEA